MNPVSIENNRDECNLYIAILQHAPYGVIVCDEPGDITFANQLAAFLCQQDDLQNSNLLKIMATVPDFKSSWESLLTGDRNNIALPCSIGRSINDHEVPHLLLQATVFKPNSDQENRVLVCIEDLSINETLVTTDQHYTDSLENLVNEKNKELEFIQEQLIVSEKKAAMIETAGAIAHDLRQPMTTIIGIIELLDSDDNVENNSNLFKRFKTIQKQCLRMAEIIKQMEQLVEYKTRPYVDGSLIIDLKESSQR